MKSVFKYILISVFLISALLKLADFENTVILFSNVLGLNYSQGKLSLVISVIIELFISLAILKDWYYIKTIYYFTLFVFCFFVILNTTFLVNGFENCGCMGTFVISNPLFGLIKNILMMVIFVFISV